MSRFSKPLTVAKLEDITLGVFAYVPTSRTLEHFIRYVSSTAGTECVEKPSRCDAGSADAIDAL